MAFDDVLGWRVRAALSDRDDVTEMRTFGVLTFMVAGKMCVGVIGDALMVRVGPEAYADALSQPHVRPMDFTGRPLTGFVYVSPDGVATEEMLRAWVDRAVAHVTRLPAKAARRSRRPLTRRAKARP